MGGGVSGDRWRYLHPEGLPSDYTITFLFRILPETPEEPFALWEILNKEYEPLVGVILDNGGKTLTFFNYDYKGEFQTVTFEGPDIKKVFYGSFHKLHVVISKTTAKVVIDCKQVSEKIINAAGNISSDGVEVLGRMVRSRGPRDNSAPRDEESCPALPHSCSCSEVSKGPHGPPGPPVFYRVVQVSEVQRVTVAMLVQRDQMVLVVKLEFLGPKGHLGPRVPVDFLSKDFRESQEHLDLQGGMEIKAKGACQARMGPPDLKDLQDLWEYLGLQVCQELQEMLGHQVMLGNLFQASLFQRELFLDPLVNQDGKEDLDHRENKDLPEGLDFQAVLASLVDLVKEANAVLGHIEPTSIATQGGSPGCGKDVLLVYQERRESEEAQVLDHKAPEGLQDQQDLRVRVGLAALALQDHQVQEAHLGTVVLLGHRVQQGPQVTAILLPVLVMEQVMVSIDFELLKNFLSTPRGYGDPTDQDIPVVPLPHNSYQLYDPEDLYDDEQEPYLVHGSYPHPQSSYPEPHLAQPEFTPVREEMEADELRSPRISHFTSRISKRSISSPIRKRVIKKTLQ
ncbi:Collagen alpha-1(XIV) chain [Varanus komodoensis]|nr:Collagen alpha-1(XIV) chain [Varanus komodoensis]